MAEFDSSIVLGDLQVNCDTDVKGSITANKLTVGTGNIVAEGGVIELGKYDGNSTQARGMLLETIASSNGEASGRIFFSEHNNGDGSSQDNYGMSLFYNGDTTATYLSGAVYSHGNAVWGIKRHDNSQNGALIMSGSRFDNNVQFTGNIIVDNSSTGNAPAISLALGDSDTGLNWVSDGNFNIVANNETVARINNGVLKMYDNKVLELGTDSDMRVFHNGTSNFIEVVNGSLTIQDGVGGEELAVFTTESGAGVQLFSDGAKKFETTSVGAKVTGDLDLTSGEADFTILRIANTSTGYAGISFDASDGDFTGSDYANISQIDSLDLAISTNSSAGDITISPKGWQQSNITARFESAKTTFYTDTEVSGNMTVSGDLKMSGTDSYIWSPNIAGEATGFWDAYNSKMMLQLVNGDAVELYHNGVNVVKTTPTGLNIIGGAIRFSTDDGDNIVWDDSNTAANTLINGSGFAGTIKFQADSGVNSVAQAGAFISAKEDDGGFVTGNFKMVSNSTEDSLDFIYLG